MCSWMCCLIRPVHFFGRVHYLPVAPDPNATTRNRPAQHPIAELGNYGGRKPAEVGRLSLGAAHGAVGEALGAVGGGEGGR